MEYAQGNPAPPPEIVVTAARYGAASGMEWLNMPANLAYKLRSLYNIYDAMRSYTAAGARGQTVKWTELNPAAWDIVSNVLAKQRQERGN